MSQWSDPTADTRQYQKDQEYYDMDGDTRIVYKSHFFVLST